MPTTNRQITLAARPTGWPKESDFKFVDSPVPVPAVGQVLIQTLYLSVDPYMRGRMNDRASYADPVKIGEVMVASAVGRVIRSASSRIPEGAIVGGMWGWQEFAVSDDKNIRLVDPALAPITTALGVLGMPGMTAYFGLLDICKPQKGETVLVSAAAGAVGSCVGQIAKIHGSHVVGVAGGAAKVNHVVNDLGFDTAFDYKTVTNYVAKLREVCPQGIDVYFDNVGGPLTDAVFQVMNLHARISVCGQISQYNLDKPELGPRLLWKLIEKGAKVEGFLVFDYAARYKEASAQIVQWLSEGKLKYRESIVVGFENTPKAFLGMLHGENVGKQLVKVSDS